MTAQHHTAEAVRRAADHSGSPSMGELLASCAAASAVSTPPPCETAGAEERDEEQERDAA